MIKGAGPASDGRESEEMVQGTIEAIFVAGKGGDPMQRVEEAEAVKDGGLRGDRYMERAGYWTNVDECQVTLIAGETLDRIASGTSVKVQAGEHRRNIVTRGIDLMSLVGKRFQVGAAELVFDRPRPPCGYIQTITEKGMTKALGGFNGGICARVLTDGVIRPGDTIDLSDVTG
jgi:MOSC domain-containing protein YiiM